LKEKVRPMTVGLCGLAFVFWTAFPRENEKMVKKVKTFSSGRN